MNITKNEQGQHAWNRWISFIGAAAMSIAFVKEAAINSLVWQDYVGYSIGMAIMYSPVLAVKIIKLWKAPAGMTSSSSSVITKTETHASPKKAGSLEGAE